MRADLHVHTVYSPDSLLRLDDLLGLARRRGLGCLAVTDHNTIAGAMQLARRSPPFHLIVGEEVLTREGEITGLFLREGIPPGLGIQETIGLIRDQGGLVVLPHPCDRLRRHSVPASVWESVVPLVDLVEGFNGRTVFAPDDRAAADLAARYRKPLAAGSDCHTRWELGRCGMLLDSFGDPADFAAAVARGCFFGRRTSPAMHLVTKAVKAANRLGLREQDLTR